VKKPFDKVIGIIGGGQLGKMLIESASNWNVSFAVLDEPGAPALPLADIQIHGKLTDGEAIRKLAAVSDILTFEIEHIDVDTLHDIQASGKQVYPTPAILELIKDKGLQKEFYQDRGLPTAPFVLVEDDASWQTALDSWLDDTVVVKSRKEGYDGKGVSIVSRTQLIEGYRPFTGPSLLEKHIVNATELSVIVARDIHKNTNCYPVAEMVFDPEANLVDFLVAPANISLAKEEQAKEIALKAVHAMDGVGLFAVEMFLSATGELFINEIAPRPHNSGHHTIEACYTSQYQQLVRILLGLPLGDTSLLRPAVMINVLGPAGVDGDYQILGLDQVLKIPGVYLHLYNKKTTRYKRKMGHCTILGDTREDALQKAAQVKAHLRLAAV
jgi:5-(carboxyamino)imidazole ribonucleotide synthase